MANMMSRRHYDLVAACVKQQRTECGRIFGESNREAARQGIRMVAEAFALEASLDNPRFDRKRFMAACGFNTEGR